MLTFTLREPHQIALRLVRRALSEHGLHTPAELDMALRINQELGARVAPFNVLFVDDPALLLEAILYHRSAALRIPQPVLVSAGHSHTEVLVRSTESLLPGGPALTQDPLCRLQRRIIGALGTVAERQGAELLIGR